ncbi:MAG: Spy/CpxP family protein refolding chaperone [Candidatus Cloacimonetes bacterium]|jgi:Spy/CpxP family protein refolding chaperone|nr:Spy/CpxP family protein refolding chaperone [Candidatus Cloacimonadota bacterium]MDD4156600.1 Spy/CpxP family protein refolding chaperone [Candidatus Cloacimonadota bacterium]
MKKIIVFSVILVTISIFSAQLYAQFPDRKDNKNQAFREGRNDSRMKNRYDGMMNMRLGQLDLNSQQQSKIDELSTAHKKAMIDKDAQIKKLYLDKETALDNEDFKQAKSISDQIYKHKAEISNARIDYLENIYKELSPEQKAELKENQGQRRFDERNKRFNRD